jgi:glutamate/tyrosine decarboxylase-like PLP-dependent enzyme
LIVASAGTIDIGAIDPLVEIAAIARIWRSCTSTVLSGLFALCDEGRHARWAGFGDSIALDPHKTLFLPYGTGALLSVTGPFVSRLQSRRRLYSPVRRERRRTFSANQSMN